MRSKAEAGGDSRHLVGQREMTIAAEPFQPLLATRSSRVLGLNTEASPHTGAQTLPDSTEMLVSANPAPHVSLSRTVSWDVAPLWCVCSMSHGHPSPGRGLGGGGEQLPLGEGDSWAWPPAWRGGLLPLGRAGGSVYPSPSPCALLWPPSVTFPALSPRGAGFLPCRDDWTPSLSQKTSPLWTCWRKGMPGDGREVEGLGQGARG